MAAAGVGASAIPFVSGAQQVTVPRISGVSADGPVFVEGDTSTMLPTPRSLGTSRADLGAISVFRDAGEKAALSHRTLRQGVLAAEQLASALVRVVQAQQ